MSLSPVKRFLIAGFLGLVAMIASANTGAHADGTTSSFTSVSIGHSTESLSGSSTGQLLLGCSSNNNDRIQSRNFGTTWSTVDLNLDSDQNFRCYKASISTDGSVQILSGLFCDLSDCRAAIYLSTDFGSSWSRLSIPTFNSFTPAIATINPDGNKIFFGLRDTRSFRLYSITSTNSVFGTPQELSAAPEVSIVDIATNSSGSVITVLPLDGGVLYSLNGGSVWNRSYPDSDSRNLPFIQWLSPAATPTSGYAYVMVKNSVTPSQNDLYRSSNSGVTWTKIANQQFYSEDPRGISASMNAKRVLIGARTGLYSSTDFGASFSKSDLSGTGATNNIHAVWTPYSIEGRFFVEYSNGISSATFTFAAPSTPDQLVAGGCSTTATLRWSNSTSTEGVLTDYSIQYSSNGGNTWNTWNHTASTANTSSITGLVSGTTYSFRVAAVSEYKTGDYVQIDGVLIGPSTIEHACLLEPTLDGEKYLGFAVSADGTKIAATGYDYTEQNGAWSWRNGRIHRSTNTGTTWSNISTGDSDLAIGGSPDGTCYIRGGMWDGQPKISKNSGSTWSVVSSIPIGSAQSNRAFAVGPNCSSSTGTYAVAWSTGIYLSTDGGNTFTQKNANNFASIAMSTSTTNVGDKMVAGLTNGKLMFSNNRGASWFNSSGTNLPTGKWGNIVMSADGTKVAATLSGTGNGSKVWISTNGGISFTGVSPYPGFSDSSWFISAAKNGSNRLVAEDAYNRGMAYSGDWGSTWKVYYYNPSTPFNAIECNADCSKIFISDYEGIHVLNTDAKSLVQTRNASGAVSGSPLTVQPQIAVKNAFSEIVTSDNSTTATVTVSGAMSTGGSSTATATNGIIVFDPYFSITAYEGYKLLTFSADGFEPLYQSLYLGVGQPYQVIKKFLFSSGQQFVSNAAIGIPFAMAIADDGGNIVTTDNGSVITLSISSGGAVIGSNTATTVNGVATFGEDLGFAGTLGSTYGLTFSSPNLNSYQSSVQTVAGSAAKIAITRASVGTASNSVFTTEPQITIQDAGGNRVTGATDTIYATISSGGYLIGTRSVAAVNGVATFPSDFGIRGTAGSTYTIRYYTQYLGSANATVTVTPGVAEAIRIRRNASGTGSGAPFSTQPMVEIRDADGNVVTSDSTSVISASISSGGVLIGTTTATAVNGIATFASDFGIGGTAGQTYVLRFSTGSFSTVTQSITVTPGPAKTAYLTRDSVGTASGAAFTTQPQVTLKDAQGNIVTNDNSTVVTATVSYGAFLGGTITATVSSGVATFTNLGITGLSGATPTISYGGVGITAATQTVTVSTGPAYGIARTTRPDGATMGTPFLTQPVYQLTDNFGNLQSSDNSTVLTVSISGCTGCVSGETATAVNGVVTFTNLAIIGGSPGFKLFTVTGVGLAGSYTDSIILAKGTAVLSGTNQFTVSYGASGATITAPTSNTPGTFTYSSSDTSILTVSGGTYSTPGVGSVTVTATFTPTNSDGYYGTTRTLSFTVEKATPLVSTTSISKTFGDSTFTVNNASSQIAGSISYSTNNPGIISLSGSTATVVAAGSGTLTATLTPTDTAHYNSGFALVSVTVAKANQSALSISSTSGYLGTSLTLTTSGGTSGGNVSFTKTGSCTLSNGVVSVSHAGDSCSVTATMPGGVNYNDVSSSATTINFAKAVQTLSLDKPSDQEMSATPFDVSATSNLTGATIVIQAGPSDVCTNSGVTITMVAPGLCSITATSVGNSDWEDAPQASTSFSITGKANIFLAPIFNFTGSPGDAQNLSLAPAKDRQNNDVEGTYSFTSENSAIASVNGSNQLVYGSSIGMTRITATFTPTNGSAFNTASISFLATTQKRMQPALHIDTPSAPYGTNVRLTLTGGAGNGAVTYRVMSGPCTVTGGLVTGTGIGTCHVRADKLGDADYQDTQIETNILITVKDASVLTPNITIKYGQTLPAINPTVIGMVSPDSISGFTAIGYQGTNGTNYPFSVTAPTLPGTYSMLPAAPMFASGTPGSYLFNTTPGTLIITLADQVIDFPAIGETAYRSSSIALNPTVNSDQTVALASSTTGVCSLTGYDLTLNALGTCTLTATQAGDSNHFAATPVVRTFSVVKATPIIGNFPDVVATYGDGHISFTAPDSSETGTFTYTSSNPSVVSFSRNDTTTVTVLTPGTSTITATFTPSNTSLYNGATASMVVTVSKATQSPIIMNPVSFYVGQTVSLTWAGGSGTGMFHANGVSGTCVVGGGVTSSTAQTCIVRITRDGDNNYLAAYKDVTFTVLKNGQTINFPTIANRSFTSVPFTITAPTSSSGTNPTVTSETTNVCTISGLTVTVVSQGLCTLKAVVASSTNYEAAADVYQNFSISGKGTVTIATDAAIPSAIHTNAAPVTISAGTPSVSGTFSYSVVDTSVATVANNVLTPVAVGTTALSAVFTPTDTTNYSSKTVLFSVKVTKAPQSTVTIALSRTTVDKNETVTVTAGGGSGTGLRAIVVTSGTCTFDDTSTVRTNDYGDCTFRVESFPDNTYDYAQSSLATLHVVDPNAVDNSSQNNQSSGGGGSGGFGGPMMAPPSDSVATLTYALSGTTLILKWSGNTTPVTITVTSTDGTKRTVEVSKDIFQTEITGLTAGFAYAIKVAPKDSLDAASGKTLSISLLPAQPSGVQVKSVDDKSIRIEWTKDLGTSLVRIALSATGESTVNTTSTGSSIVLSAKPGVYYTVSLIAVSGSELVSDAYTTSGTFIQLATPVPVATPTPTPTPTPSTPSTTGSGTTTPGKTPATATVTVYANVTTYFANKQYTLAKAELASLKSLITKISKGRTVTCAAYLPGAKPTTAVRTMMLRQARAACTAAVGKVKGVIVVQKSVALAKAPKATRASSAKANIYRVDVTVSK